MIKLSRHYVNDIYVNSFRAMRGVSLSGYITFNSLFSYSSLKTIISMPLLAFLYNILIFSRICLCLTLSLSLPHSLSLSLSLSSSLEVLLFSMYVDKQKQWAEMNLWSKRMTQLYHDYTKPDGSSYIAICIDWATITMFCSM